MANEQQVAPRQLIMAAAHGAWMAFLVGILLGTVSFIAWRLLLTYYPEFVSAIWGVPPQQAEVLWVTFLGLWKLLAGVFLLLGVALSYWWRAL